MKVLADYGDHLDYRIPLSDSLNGQPLYLDCYLRNQNLSSYLQIESEDLSAVRDRINFDTDDVSRDRSKRYSDITYHRQNSSSPGQIFVAEHQQTSCRILCVNPVTGKIDTFITYTAPDSVLQNGTWDGYFGGITFFPADHPGPLDMLFFLGVGLSHHPRVLYGYSLHPDGRKSELFRRRFGNPTMFCAQHDIDDDGEDELFFGTSAPGNGRTGSGLDDSHQYAFALDQRGRILWKRDFGYGGGGTKLVDDPLSSENLIAIRRIVSFSDEANTTWLYRLRAADGEVLDSVRINGQVVPGVRSPVSGNHLLLHTDTRTEILQWLDAEFSRYGPPLHTILDRGNWYHGYVRMGEPDPQDFLLVHLLNDWSLLLDSDLHPVAAYPGLLAMDSRSNDDPHLRDGQFRLFLFPFHMSHTDRPPTLIKAEFVKKPWIVWMGWRQRWYLLAWFSLILLFPAAWLIVRYFRLRAAARRAVFELNTQLGLLIRRLQSSQEEERFALSHEVHDNIGQSLVLLRWEVGRLTPSGDGNSHSFDEAKSGLIQSIEHVLETIHDVSSGIRPSILDDAGLFPTLTWFCDHFQQRTGIRCTLDTRAAREPGSSALKNHLYRILQEGLSNVVKHADAGLVEMVAEEEDGAFHLTLRDDGNGLDETRNSTHISLGLLGMNERLKPFGGEAYLVNRPEGGALLDIRIPLDRYSALDTQDETHDE